MPRGRRALVAKDHAARVRGDPLVELVFRLGIDHRPDMRRDIARIADDELPRRALDHLDDAVRHILLHAQQPQRRAALAGGAERRGDHVVGHLLGQRGGVHDHGIDAAGLGDQRDDRPVLGGERAVDRPRDLGRAGEGHAGHARIGNERRARFAVAEHEMQRARRHAGLVQQPHRRRRDQRRLLGGLGDHRIAGTSAATTCPMKIASGKFHGLMQTNTPRPR